MLRPVRYGNLGGCLSAALDVIAFPEESEQIKSYAVFAVPDAGDDQSRQRLAEIVQQMEIIESRLCAWILSAPTALAPKCTCYFLVEFHSHLLDLLFTHDLQFVGIVGQALAEIVQINDGPAVDGFDYVACLEARMIGNTVGSDLHD